MTRMFRPMIVLLLNFNLCILATAFAETVVLKTSQTVEGKIIEKTDKYIKIDFLGVPLIYYLDEIQSIDGVNIQLGIAQENTNTISNDKIYTQESADSTYQSSGVMEEQDIISTVDATNVVEQYVVIYAGRDQGIKVGDNFTLSRKHYVSAHVVVFEVADSTCKARGYKGTTIEDVRAGDKAYHHKPTMKENRDFLWLCAILIGLALGVLSVFWLGYTRMSNYVKRHNFWNSRFLSVSFMCLNVWFWFLFLSGSLFIGWTTYLSLFVDGLYIQNLMLLYPFVGFLIFGTFCVALVLIFIFRRAS